MISALKNLALPTFEWKPGLRLWEQSIHGIGKGSKIMNQAPNLQNFIFISCTGPSTGGVISNRKIFFLWNRLKVSNQKTWRSFLVVILSWKRPIHICFMYMHFA